MTQHDEGCIGKQRLIAHHYGRSGLETTCTCVCHPKVWEHGRFAEANHG